MAVSPLSPMLFVENQIFRDAAAVRGTADRAKSKRTGKCRAVGDHRVILPALSAWIDAARHELRQELRRELATQKRGIELARAHGHNARPRLQRKEVAVESGCGFLPERLHGGEAAAR